VSAKSTRRPGLPDRLGPEIDLLLVGINPGLRSAALGHHFAGHGNRFWRLLHESGLIPDPLTFADDGRLPEFGLGLTNLVARATRGIDQLRPSEYAAGRAALERTIRRTRPLLVGLIGLTLARALGPRGPLALGPQAWRLRDVEVFVVPNPSGRNAHYGYSSMLDAYRALAARIAVLRGSRGRESASQADS
jgi:TDG/mug DNA glycosylase family protein